MKQYLFFFFTILLSCNSIDKEVLPNSEPVISTKDFIDFGFDTLHPNSNQFNSMLNSYSEEFIPLDITWDSWENEDLIQGRFAFRTVRSNLELYLIFCSHQNDCISICQANFEPRSDKLIWGVNGGVAFVVSGENTNEINQLVGFLAGEE